MKMKNIFFFLLILAPACFLNAQNSMDALRYSRFDYSGTARFNAMGGSFGALGGELSGVMINPAGLGLYRNSEFTFSTSFEDFGSETSYKGNNSSNNKLNFNIPNIGYIGAYKGDPDAWKNYSFSIQFNRVNNFNKEYQFSSSSPDESIIYEYVNTLNRNGANISSVENFDFPAGPSEAWNVFLIDTTLDAGNLLFVPTFEEEFIRANGASSVPSDIRQQIQIESEGSQSEVSFSFGGNYIDRLYLGGSLNLQRVRYEKTTLLQEQYIYTPVALASDSLVSDYREIRNLQTNGTGINLKIGMIYRIIDQLRAGLSIHSPTFFGLTEEFSFRSDSEFSDGGVLESGETIFDFKYNLRTPTRYIASLAYIHNRSASINLDYEYVDYTKAQLDDNRNDEFDFSTANAEIDNNLEGTHNVRVGGEYKLSPFVLRAGYRYESNPFSSRLALGPDESRETYSLGGGFRSKNFNLDLAYRFSKMDALDPLLSTVDFPALSEEERHSVMITLGWKW